jgi:LPS export ABC transporter protein LptC
MTNHSGYIVCIVCACLLAVSCSNDIDKIQLLTEPDHLPLEKGKNITIIYTDSGWMKAKVVAPTLQRFATATRNETELPEGVAVTFFNRNQQAESFISAKYALRYDRERKMVAKNDVILVNIKGDTLRTEELFWDETEQKIYSNQSVRITTPDEIILGKGFESNLDFSKYRIKEISGIISMHPDQ